MGNRQPSTPTEPSARATQVDVIIVGAGLAGIGAAWRLGQRTGLSFLILEAREGIGGTWDLFRYPGVRSDSDMHTFSYPFRPWTRPEVFASGNQIRDYIAATAAECRADEKIIFGCRVTAASWASHAGEWTVEAQTTEGPACYSCSWLYLCTGYYDYSRAYRPDYPGREEFRGPFVTPQFWPRDLDCADREVVVIGSGASAITLAPALARAGARVTMLQRSPSYVASLPATRRRSWTSRRLSPRATYRVRRTFAIAGQQGFWEYCRRWPDQAASSLRRRTASAIGWPLVEEHFTPRYRPWEQRLCVAPDGDLFAAINAGNLAVVTDQIDRFAAEGIRLASGRTLPADVIVSATGLVLRPVGGISLQVDGRVIDPGQTTSYRGMMLGGVPNLVYTLGYANGSWTLRADLVARWVCRLLRHLRRRGFASATPVGTAVKPVADLIPLTSGYVRRGSGLFPRQGNREPWRLRQNYLTESLLFRCTPLGKDLAFTPVAGPVRAEPVDA